jgi:DNA-binding response OmpR family regulator
MPATVIPHPGPRSRAIVVLFIDDNVTQLDLYSMMVETEFTVVKATRGETGYHLAINEHPDVIVLDLLLPDVDGFALTSRLAANPATARIPIIVLSGDDAAYDRAAQMRLRYREVLNKPCPTDRLLTAIRAVARQS